MPTESTAVAKLIRGVQMRRLESEPGDVFVFDAPAKRAPRPHYAHVLAPRVTVHTQPPRFTAPAHRPARATPHNRRWLIAIAILAGFGGAIGASYVPLGDDTPAPAAVVEMPAARLVRPMPAMPAMPPRPDVVPPPEAEVASPPPAPPIKHHVGRAKHRR